MQQLPFDQRSGKIWFNNELCEWQDARVHIISHGMQAHAYPEMMQMILEHKIAPEQLIGRRISLEAAAEALTRMDSFEENGMAMITQF